MKSDNIIYKSGNAIPWDTQSAFKLTRYDVHSENNMIFCYFKVYVKGDDLVLCSYCFKENPTGMEDLHLQLLLHPEKNNDILHIVYGFDGVKSIEIEGKNQSLEADTISFYPFKANDEQGYYWCGEITISGCMCKQLFGDSLKNNDTLKINLTEMFANGDYMTLESTDITDSGNPFEHMQTFVVLDY